MLRVRHFRRVDFSTLLEGRADPPDKQRFSAIVGVSRNPRLEGSSQCTTVGKEAERHTQAQSY